MYLNMAIIITNCTITTVIIFKYVHYPIDKHAINLENIFKISKISIFEGIFLEVIYNNSFLLLENIVITPLYCFTLYTVIYSETFKYQIISVAKIFSVIQKFPAFRELSLTKMCNLF